jgi:poly(3-hydroxybutyrate) depolymerase
MAIRARIVGGLAAALLAAGPAVAAEALPSFKIDLARTTVSGLSSGGFMAAQFHVAFSGIVQGAGIVAGGPWGCAEGQLALALNRCMQTFMGTPDASRLSALAGGEAQQARIDPLTNLEDDRLYLFSGGNDRTVTRPVVEAAVRFYRLAGLPEANIRYQTDLRAGHAMLTEDFGDPCPSTDPPFINDCDLDQAGAILNQLYPGLNAPAEASGRIVAFDQAAFFPAGFMPSLGRSLGLGSTGYAYVPAACAAGETCRVHVVFHGCKQTPEHIGDAYVRHTGYNRWAESNDLIILYPQAKTESLSNPNGCWDWWGYSGAGYATKAGPQMMAVRAMLDRLAGTTAPVAGAGLRFILRD